MRAGFQCFQRGLRGPVVIGSFALFALAVSVSLVRCGIRAASAAPGSRASVSLPADSLAAVSLPADSRAAGSGAPDSPAAPSADAASVATSAPSSAARETFLRRRVAELALEQLREPDPRWEIAQRDCAGLIRFAYRGAFHRFEPGRAQPLFRDERGNPAEFADARTLVSSTFLPLGRGAEARSALRNGDLLAFRIDGGAGEPEHHLMLVVVPEGAPASSALVVYHPGTPGAAIRSGTLRALEEEAPIEWRPVPENASFLGFHRFKEWIR